MNMVIIYIPILYPTSSRLYSRLNGSIRWIPSVISHPEVNHLFIVYNPLAGKDGLERVLTSMIFVGDTCVVSLFLFNHTRVNPHGNTLSRHTKDIQLFMLITIREIGID